MISLDYFDALPRNVAISRQLSPSPRQILPPACEPYRISLVFWQNARAESRWRSLLRKPHADCHGTRLSHWPCRLDPGSCPSDGTAWRQPERPRWGGAVQATSDPISAVQSALAPHPSAVCPGKGMLVELDGRRRKEGAATGAPLSGRTSGRPCECQTRADPLPARRSLS